MKKIRGIVFIGGLITAAVGGGWLIDRNKGIFEAIDWGRVLGDRTEDNEYRVSRIIDGDTIELVGGAKVRYIGIDTPETVDPRKEVQCFGTEASARNRELVEGRVVDLEKDVSETDRYGRWLRYVYVDGVMINQKLVEEGYAKTDTVVPDVKYKDELIEAEKNARINNKGLWKNCQ